MVRNITVPKVGPIGVGISDRNEIRIEAKKAEVIQLILNLGLENIGIYNDPYGLFNVSYDIVNRKVVFGRMGASQYAIRPDNGCGWSPTAKSFVKNNSIALFGLRAQLEQCYDEFVGSCFRQMLGKGNSVKDILATPEGTDYFYSALKAIFAEAVNDITALIWFGRHELIKQAYDNGVTAMDEDVFNNFYSMTYGDDPSLNPLGITTALDTLNMAGLPQFSVPINSNDLKGSYSGDALSFMSRLKAAAPSKFRTQSARNPRTALFVLSRDMFERGKEQLGDKCCSDELIKAKLLGKNDSIGWGYEHYTYNGHIVIPNDIWDTLDEATSTKSARGMFIAAGNIGVGFDVGSVGGNPDLAFQVEQDNSPKGGGLVTGRMNFDLGVGIIDRDYVSYGQITKAIVPFV